MLESVEASSASCSLPRPAPPAFSGPPHAHGTSVYPPDADDSHGTHSSRRSSGKHGYVRLRNSAGNTATARGSCCSSPVPTPWAVVLDALAGLRDGVEALEAAEQGAVGDSTQTARGLSPTCSATFLVYQPG